MGINLAKNLKTILLLISSTLLISACYRNSSSLQVTPETTVTLTPASTTAITKTPIFWATSTSTAKLETISPTVQLTSALGDGLIPPTPKPKVTLQSTKTPIATPNPIFTPSAPLADIYHYRLVDLTSERMDELVDVMAHYPEALSFFDQGYHQENVFYERRHAALLLGEALLRFPNDDRTIRWKWQRAKHLYIAGRTEAKEAYISLILDALNSQQTDLAGLPGWFAKNEPELELSARTLTPLPDYQGSYLISVRDWANGFYFWLLESQVGYQAFQIDSYKDTGTAHASGTSFGIGDITGDGRDDLVIVHGRQPGNFFYAVGDFFDLGQIPPKAILFEPEPLNYEGKWNIEKSDESTYLKYEYHYDYFTCLLPTIIHYQWNGRVMEPVFIEDITHRTDACIDAGIRDLLREAKWGNQIPLDTLLSLVDGYPYDKNPKSTEIKTISENQAELRFSLGLLLAYAHRTEEAISQFEAIVTIPGLSETGWAGKANQMLQAYHSSKDIREACLITDLCYETQSYYQAYLSLMLPDDRMDPASFFSDLGAEVVSKGSLDMDEDGMLEHWFVEEDSMYINWLWVFTYQNGEMVADRIYVNRTEGVKTYSLRKIESLPGLPVYELLSFETDIFIFDSQAIQSSDFLQPFYLKEEGILDQIETDLLSGKNFNEQEQKLLKIQTLSYFYSQARVRYLLGLCAELQGVQEKAAHLYWRLWRDYPDSPYAIIAHSKLELISP